jgi:hypothetical protein
MINKMSAIPATSKNFFGTASANMPKAVVRIVEGESTLPAECTPLGNLRCRAAAVPAKRLTRRAGLRIQREPGPRSGSARLRQRDEDLRSNGIPASRRMRLNRPRQTLAA